MIDPPLPMSVESAKLGQEASAAPPIPVWVAMAAPEINMKAVGVITNIMKTRLLILVATQPDMENLLASLQVKALLITGNHIENLSYKVKSTKIKKVSRLVLFI